MKAKVTFAVVRIIKATLKKTEIIKKRLEETGEPLTFGRKAGMVLIWKRAADLAGIDYKEFKELAQKPLEELYAMARETQYEAMTPEQRANYDRTVEKNKAFNDTVEAMCQRIKATQQKMQEQHDKAVEEYRKGQEVHITNVKLQANNKVGKVNLGERKCPVCGKTIFIQDKTAWIYKVRYGKGFVYLCSESCKEQKLSKKAKRGKKK